MLTRIQLENFKSWRKLDLELAPITLLFGTNSSGKTAILQSLLLLKQTVNSFDRKQHLNFGGGERDYVDFGSWRDLVHAHVQDRSVGVRIEAQKDRFEFERLAVGEVDLEAYENLFVASDIRWRQLDDEVVIAKFSFRVPEVSLSFEALRTDEEQYAIKVWDEPDQNEVLVDFLPIESCYRIKFDEIIGVFETKRGGFEDTIFWMMQEFNYAFEAIIKDFVYLGPIRESPRRNYQWSGTRPYTIGPKGENTVASLLASERQDERLVLKVSEWLARMGLVDEFQLEALDRDKRFYESRVKIGNTSSSLLDVGFGVSQVLPVVTLLFFAPEGSIILLEQPELHLHPSAQAVLADLLLDVAETRKLQLIVESHSEHLLRRLQRRIAEPENAFASPENIKMYFCQIQDGESKAEEVIVDQYGQIKNWPDNFFGDILDDLNKMTDAALARRRQELEQSG